VLDNAEIEDFRFHDLRHCFATRLVQNGDIYKVAKLMGHKQDDSALFSSQYGEPEEWS
jgi:integrase